MKFEELEAAVLNWAMDRGIIPHASSLAQFTKCVEEIGEIAAGLGKRKPELVADGIGDTLVTLILLARLEGLDLVSCLAGAYDQIKDRRGQLTSAGIFVKEEDLPCA
jgi:hypothetical protein